MSEARKFLFIHCICWKILLRSNNSQRCKMEASKKKKMWGHTCHPLLAKLIPSVLIHTLVHLELPELPGYGKNGGMLQINWRVWVLTKWCLLDLKSKFPCQSFCIVERLVLTSNSISCASVLGKISLRGPTELFTVLNDFKANPKLLTLKLLKTARFVHHDWEPNIFPSNLTEIIWQSS